MVKHPNPPMKGYIQNHVNHLVENLQHQTSSSSTKSIRKRCRETEGVYEYINDFKTTGFFFHSLIISKEGNKKDEQGDESKRNDCYKMIIPYMYLTLSCLAAQFHHLVIITNYTIRASKESYGDKTMIIEVHHDGLYIFKDDKYENNDNCFFNSLSSSVSTSVFMTLQDIYHSESIIQNQLEINRKQNSNLQNTECSESCNYYHKSLQQIERNKTYSFMGIVDCISPIIATPENRKSPSTKSKLTTKNELSNTSPSLSSSSCFAFIELYQPISSNDAHNKESSNETLSTIIILKGHDAISIHSSILPGETLYVENVRKVKWNVFQSLANRNYFLYSKLTKRVTSCVFVVTKSNQIAIWKSLQMSFNHNLDKFYYRYYGDNSNDVKESTHDNDEPDGQFITLHPPIPSIMYPLTLVEGRITCIKYKTHLNHRFIHYVIISTDISSVNGSESNKGPIYKSSKLYLTHYPLSPDLYHGLRINTFIRATNVHKYNSFSSYFIKLESETDCKNDSFFYYGACLRSTITILICASDDVHFTQQYDSEVQNQNNRTEKHHSHKLPIFHFIGKIDHSYEHYEWIEYYRLSWFEICITTIDAIPSKMFEQLMFDLLNKLHPKRNKQRHIQRDPYEEFFDHGCNFHLEENEETDTMHSGCFAESNISNINHFPLVLSLMDIKNTCIEEMKRSLSAYLSGLEEKNDLKSYKYGAPLKKAGWTASIELSPGRLLNLLYSDSVAEMMTKNDEISIYTGGIITEISKENSVTKLKDNYCEQTILPINESTFSINERSSRSYKPNDFVLVKIYSCVISSICLGGSIDGCSNNIISHLPPISKRTCNKRIGSTLLLHVNDSIFMVTVQIVCNMSDTISIHQRESAAVEKEDKMFKAMNPLQRRSVQIISLNQSFKNNTISDSFYRQENDCHLIIGRLVRQQWNFKKCVNGDYFGVTLTMSHVPVHDNVPSNFRSFQTIEVVLSIKLDDHLSDYIRNKIVQMYSNSPAQVKVTSSYIPQALITTAAAWWGFAEDANYSAVLIGGWDECCLEYDHHLVYLQIPQNQYEYGQGCSPRITCSKEAFNSKLINTITKIPSFQPSCSFQYLNNRLSLPGLLSTSQDRLSQENILAGIQSISLSQLQALAYRIDTNSPTFGILRRLPNAQLCSINFCVARVQCTKCFSYLEEYEQNHDSSTPDIDSTAKIGTRFNIVETEPYQKLKCPEGCDASRASVKWELSGEIVDGTSSSIIYAERNTVNKLLGDDLDVATIELGAWQSSRGVVFNKKQPIRRKTREAFWKCVNSDARSKSRVESESFKCDPRPPSTDDIEIIKSMPLIYKAEYLLHRYCTQSKVPYRSMNYLVRCKPMSSPPKLVIKDIDKLVDSVSGETLTMKEKTKKNESLRVCLVHCFENERELAFYGWGLYHSLIASTD